MILKKPKFWDYNKPNIFAYILSPIAYLIKLINFFLQTSKPRKFRIKTICLGNIYVGGTSKTPLTIKLNQILQKLHFKTATIKKYYKDQIDEQKLLSMKSNLYCRKKRLDALDVAIKDKIDIAIFDDGLQDRHLKYDLSFVCFNNINWIGNGLLIPSGPLREKLKSISKYDAIFLNGNDDNNSDIKNSIKKIDPNIKIFETYYEPTNHQEFNIEDNYLIFSGIANPDSFKNTLLKKKFKIIKEINFPDHYQYKKKDIEEIKLIAENIKAKIITTEKDFVKIPKEYLNNINFLEIDIIIKQENELISFIKSKI